jgi:hypothetical protein
MAIVTATTFALVIWVVMWALGVKAFDGVWIVIAIVLLAATAHIVMRYLPSRRQG